MIPTGLLEPRYFIIPVTFLLIHLPSDARGGTGLSLSLPPTIFSSSALLTHKCSRRPQSAEGRGNERLIHCRLKYPLQQTRRDMPAWLTLAAYTLVNAVYLYIFLFRTFRSELGLALNVASKHILQVAGWFCSSFHVVDKADRPVRPHGASGLRRRAEMAWRYEGLSSLRKNLIVKYISKHADASRPSRSQTPTRSHKDGGKELAMDLRETHHQPSEANGEQLTGIANR